MKARYSEGHPAGGRLNHSVEHLDQEIALLSRAVFAAVLDSRDSVSVVSGMRLLSWLISARRDILQGKSA